MVKQGPLHIALEGTVNTRDVGGWPLRQGGLTRPGRLWRSDAFTHATDRDLDTLAHHRVRTVIDLRTAAERQEEPHPLEGDARFEVIHIDLFGPVLAAFLRGEIHGDPYDLRTHYRASFELALQGYIEAFEGVERALDGHDGPVVVHCTAGKDRTGLITALLLHGAGVGTDDIARDYALTAERISPIRDRLLADGVAKGFPRASYERLLEARAETLADVLQGIDGALVAAARVAARQLT